MAIDSLLALPQPFTPADAAGSGVTRGQLIQALRVGAVDRLARGLYAVAGWESRDLRERRVGLAHAAYRACGGAVVSHSSAADLWGLPYPRGQGLRATLTLVADRRTSPASSWMHLHRATLDVADVVELDGILVTAPHRTVADCLRSMAPGDGLAVGDAALRAGHVGRAEIADALRRQGGWPGARRAARWLPVLDGRRESWLESWSVVGLSRLGIEPGEPQVEIYDELGFVGRVDSYWQAYGVVGEADGAGKYLGAFDPAGPSGRGAAQQVLAEKEREDRLRGTGLEVVRWGTNEIVHAPERVAARMWAARRRGDPGRFTGWVRHTPEPTPAPGRPGLVRVTHPPHGVSRLPRERRSHKARVGGGDGDGGRAGGEDQPKRPEM